MAPDGGIDRKQWGRHAGIASRYTTLLAIFLCLPTARAFAEEAADNPPPGIAELVAAINRPYSSAELKRFVEADQATKEAAVPALIAALETSLYPKWGTHESYISRALAAVGEPVVGPLCTALESESEKVRIQAAIALRHLAARARPAVPKLIDILSHDTPRCKSVSAGALGEIAPDEPAIIEPLVRALKVDEAHSWARKALAAIGEPAVPALIRCIETDPELWSNAVRTLKEIGQAAESALPNLIKVLEHVGDEPNSAAEVAAEALAAIGPRAAVPVAEVLWLPDAGRHITDHGGGWQTIESESRHECVRKAFRLLGTDGAGGVPVLIEVLKKGTAEQRAAAADCLSYVGLDAAPALHGLRQCMRDDEAAVRSAACRALVRLGPKCREALPDVLRLLNDEFEDCRAAAVEALVHLEPDVKKVVPHVVKAVSDPSPVVRDAAAGMVAEIGPPAGAAEPALLRMLRRVVVPRAAEPKEGAPSAIYSGSMDVITTAGGLVLFNTPVALEALKATGINSPAIAQEVVRLAIGNGWYTLDRLGGNVLHLIDGKAKGAVPLLVDVVKTRDKQARVWAYRALARMGEHARPAMDHIIGRFSEMERHLWDGHVGMWGSGRLAVEIGEGEAADGVLVGIGAAAVEPLSEIYRNHRDERIRSCAFYVLAQLRCKEAVPVLGEALAEKHQGQPPSFYYRTAIYRAELAAEALAEIGPDAKEAVPALRKATKRIDVVTKLEWAGKTIKNKSEEVYHGVARKARKALHKITGESQPHLSFFAEQKAPWDLSEFGEEGVPHLITLLEDQDIRTRKDAMSALAWIGADAKAALPAMIKAAQSFNDDDAYENLAELGATLGKEGAAAVPVIDAWLKSKPDRCRRSLEPLKGMGTTGAPLIPAVTEIYQESSDERTRLAALEALAAFGADLSPLAKEHVPMLTKKFSEAVRNEDRDIEGVGYVVSQLVAFGPHASDAADRLIDIVKKRRYRHSASAARILGAIGPAAERAIPVLHLARFARNTSLAAAATDALRSIASSGRK